MTLDMFKEFIKPELLILIPVLYIVGMFLKKSESVPDKKIPLVLLIAGIVLAILYVVATTAGELTAQTVAMAVFTALCQGILCAGGAVMVNQIKVQSKKEE